MLKLMKNIKTKMYSIEQIDKTIIELKKCLFLGTLENDEEIATTISNLEKLKLELNK